MEPMNDALAVSCVLDEFKTRTDRLELTAKPILSPCVKHEIEEGLWIDYTAARYRQSPLVHYVRSFDGHTVARGIPF